MATEIAELVPDIGDFSGVEVIEVLVSEGDSVQKEDSLVTLESDKATMEIPAAHAGVVKSVKVKVGDTIGEGDLLLTLEVDQEQEQAGVDPAVAPEAPRAEVADVPEVARAPSAPTVDTAGAPAVERLPGDKVQRHPPVRQAESDLPRGVPHASPSIRSFARELGVDLALVTGTGRKGRITRPDVQNYIKQVLQGDRSTPTAATAAALPAVPEIDFSQFGEVDIQPLNRIKRISGKHLSACWLNIPHVTQFDEADITGLEAFRQEQKAEAAAQDIKLTFMPFLMKACVACLQAMPVFNSSLSPDQQQLIYKRFYHIGVAVDTPDGLVVPVIRDVERKSIFELAADLAEVSARARQGKLTPADLQGGCFSISSLGGIGGTGFTPIVNAPEVAILGVSRAAMKPVWNGRKFKPRLMLPLSLSYDHRVIDGAQAARFAQMLATLLADIRRLLL